MKEVQSKEVVADVSSLESERSITFSHLCYISTDLTVLHNLVMVITLADYSNLLCWQYLLNNLWK